MKSGYRKIDAKNCHGETALHIACNKGDEEAVRLLLGANATIDVRDQERVTPLQVILDICFLFLLFFFIFLFFLVEFTACLPL